MEDPEIQVWKLSSSHDESANVADHDQELATAIKILRQCEGFALITLKGPVVECHMSVPHGMMPGLSIGLLALAEDVL